MNESDNGGSAGTVRRLERDITQKHECRKTETNERNVSD